MKTYKAEPVGQQVIPDLLIEATESVEVIRDIEPSDIAGWNKRLDAEAEKIVDALQASLPGGTLFRIYAIFTARHANSLIIRDDSFSKQG